MQIKDIQRLIDNPLEPNASEWAMNAKDILDENDLLTHDSQEIIEQIKFFDGQGVGKKYVDQLVGILKRIIKNMNKDTNCIMNNEDIIMTGENVFIVYSHKHEDIMQKIKTFVHDDLKLEPETLDISEFKGNIWDALSEKTQNYQKAIIVMTADDKVVSDDNSEYMQTRPNVFIELGYMIHKCGLKNITIVCSGNCRIPSDISGLIYVIYESERWRESLRKQLINKN